MRNAKSPVIVDGTPMVDETCPQCHRQRVVRNEWSSSARPAVAIHVVHDEYGCPEGCCGHHIIFVDGDGAEVEREWVFDHPIEGEEAPWEYEARYHRLPITRREISEY